VKSCSLGAGGTVNSFASLAVDQRTKRNARPPTTATMAQDWEREKKKRERERAEQSEREREKGVDLKVSLFYDVRAWTYNNGKEKTR
jgi:hypothetical protein